MFKDFDSIAIGDTASLVKLITPEDIRKFVEMTGDDNPLHVDKTYAEGTPFKDIVVHGMLGASFISTIIGTKLPGEGALWMSQSIDFLLPVRLGDELTVNCTVLKKNEREQILELETKILNQNKQVVLSGVGKVKVLKRTETTTPVAPKARAKVALVTGGAGGIGREICTKLAADGYRVVVHYLSNEAGAQKVVAAITEAGGEAIAIRADLAKDAELASLVAKSVAKFGTITALVNNASPRIGAKTLTDLEWSDFDSHLNVQLRGAFTLTKLCVKEMLKQGHGRIVNLTSQVIDGNPTPTWTAYTVAKAALASFSKCLAAELGPQGIQVNCVSPGMVETALVGDIPEKARLIAARNTPLRRLATPQDIAGAVAYLASDDAGFITGQTLRVNGGQMML